ncbi:GntR family transcriptional regulator [Sinorhizobium medicae]|uniref:GntR family transcriptional regulator n=1 Tax=Sinorhizobium medicae TaxID=110321 RepID=UPI000FDCD7D1|nr:GntR family transcriptional regulator [Sinorhizobium medicae]RVO73557.1 GntR family transcriptional regulator [Sinorhizobium medicae]
MTSGRKENTTTLDIDAGRGKGAGSRGSLAYEAILNKIRGRELLPGTRLREEELAEMMGVSRTPVREALTRLHARGLIESSDNGLVITKLSRAQMMELYDMRATLEGAAARFAALRASPDDIVGLKLAMQRFSDFEGSPTQFAELNRQVHDAIYEAANNRYLIRALNELHDSRALMPDTTFSQPHRVDEAKAEHKRIVDAIIERDAVKAEQAAREHIEIARDTRLLMLFSQG